MRTTRAKTNKKPRVIMALVLFSSFLNFNTYAQNENTAIDSLKKELSNKLPKTKYIDNLNSISEDYAHKNLDSAKFYAQKAFNESNKTNYPKGKAAALSNISAVHFYSYEFDESIEYINQSLKILTDINDTLGIIDLELDLACIKSLKGQNLEATIIYKTVLNKTQTANADKFLLADTNYNLGRALMKMEKYEEALGYIQNATRLAEELKYNIILGLGYRSMGRIYVKLNIEKEGITYYNKAIAILNKDNLVHYSLETSNNLATDMLSIENFDVAEKIAKQTIKKAKKTKFKSSESSALVILGELRLKQKKYHLAEQNLLAAYEINEQIDTLREMKTQLFILLGQVYTELNDINKALKYLNMAKELSLEHYPDMSSTHLAMHEVYKKTLNFEKALDHFAMYKTYEDSIFIENKNKIVTEMKIKFETETKENENILLKKDLKINELTIEEQNNTKKLFITLAIIVAHIAVFIFYGYYSKLKLAKILTSKNEVISKQKTKLDIANQTKTKLFSIISHDLINPFNTIIGYTNLLANDYDSFNENERQEFINKINKSSILNFNLVKNLLDWSRAQQNRISVEKKEYLIKDLIDHAIAPFMFYVESKNIEIEFNISMAKLNTDSNLFKTIISNLFFNAIKFSHTKGKIRINSFINKKGRKIVTIEDFGVGMSNEFAQELLNKNTITPSFKGTDNEKGSGLGFMVCYEFVELLEGKIEITSIVGKGTIIKLLF